MKKAFPIQPIKIELKDLIGNRFLGGVDFSYAPEWKPDYYHTDNFSTVTFILDKVTYQAIEDPDDGYRSYLGKLILCTNTKIMNKFPMDLPVHCRYIYNDDYDGQELLEMWDPITEELVFVVGTERVNDYYPCFVSSFFPENLSININHEK